MATKANDSKEAKETAERASDEVSDRRRAKAYKGIDPQSGERKAVNYKHLLEEHGAAKGAVIYHRIARAIGAGTSSGYTPDLDISSMKNEQRLLQETMDMSPSERRFMAESLGTDPENYDPDVLRERAEEFGEREKAVASIFRSAEKDK